jgi:Lrp/AsnC family transcriptional regulator, leucine-responsive regulatory protein
MRTDDEYKHQAPMRLRTSDRMILGLLQQDARRSITEIAAATKLSRTTVKDRIDMMRERNVIKRFTIELAETRKDEPACGSAFFQLQLNRPVCRIIYAAISGWPELLGCWSISGNLDMVVLISATSNQEIERLRDRLARHPEVRTLQTLTILREWTDKTDARSADIVDKVVGRGMTSLMHSAE